MALELTGESGFVLLVGRVLFGGVIAFMGLNHFIQTDEMAGYAEHKGIPLPRASVLASGGMLLVGGLSLVAGVYPAIGAGAIAGFLLVTTPTMHDFWNAAGEDQQTELVQFLKNVALLGTALVFVVLAGASWPLAAGVGF